MVRSGLILAAVALVFSASATLISPLCTPCLAIVMGIFAGYLAGIQDKPRDEGKAAKMGAGAGAIGGVGALLGQSIGAAINAKMVGPERALELLNQFNIPTGGDISMPYWLGVIASALCFGVLNIVLMAGLGALGGYLWLQMNGRKIHGIYR
ncbi:MAG: hypothetical protein JW908_02450 [Anaerolineales bacterium]|nr:hypothetical protein [Anaerolineales bacterium]